MQNVFVSNVLEYTGPGVVEVLSRSNYQVICHDRSFTDQAKKEEYSKKENVFALTAQNPEEIVAELKQFGVVKKYVFNDIHPNTPKAFEDIDIEELKAAHSSLVEFPFRLCQLILPKLKQEKAGSVVFITSARQLQPEPGFAIATSSSWSDSTCSGGSQRSCTLRHTN